MTQPALVRIPPREVPLGGPRSMRVRRTLPHRDRTSVGPWVFCDHYGPETVTQRGGMDVAPHPHCGLATVSWLFAGTIRHDDSAGNHTLVRPGEVTLMTAGAGIAHSEVSTAETTTLHGVQLWLAYPRQQRAGGAQEVAPGIQHHAPDAVSLTSAVRARVFLGDLPGVARCPLEAPKRALGVELCWSAPQRVELTVESRCEHALLVDSGAVRCGEVDLAPGDLGVREAGPTTLPLEGTAGSRVVLLGGEPFDEAIVLWWNFLGSDHAEIAAARADWEDPQRRQQRYGQVDGYAGHGAGPQQLARIPAPPLPRVRLTARRNRER